MLTLTLLSRHITLRQLQVICGHLMYFASFRRPLMSLFQNVWVFTTQHTDPCRPQGSDWFVRRSLPDSVLDELWAGLLTLSLACIDLKVPVSDLVTVSDASETGGGVCYSTSLTSSGLEALGRWNKPRERSGEGILIVSAVDGISSIQVAVDRLGCPVIGSVCIGVDKAAVKVVKG